MVDIPIHKLPVSTYGLLEASSKHIPWLNVGRGLMLFMGGI